MYVVCFHQIFTHTFPTRYSPTHILQAADHSFVREEVWGRKKRGFCGKKPGTTVLLSPIHPPSSLLPAHPSGEAMVNRLREADKHQQGSKEASRYAKHGQKETWRREEFANIVIVIVMPGLIFSIFRENKPFSYRVNICRCHKSPGLLKMRSRLTAEIFHFLWLTAIAPGIQVFLTKSAIF